MNIINLPIDAIIPYERNPRKNDGAVEAVAASIREFGFKVPIVIDAQNVIVTGHTRHKAARKLGLSECPCIRADDLTPEQVRAYRLADNKVAELAEWDDDLLASELADLPDFDFAEMGFDEIMQDQLPDDLDGEEIEKPFILKITFNETTGLNKFLNEHRDELKNYYKATISISGGVQCV